MSSSSELRSFPHNSQRSLGFQPALYSSASSSSGKWLLLVTKLLKTYLKIKRLVSCNTFLNCRDQTASIWSCSVNTTATPIQPYMEPRPYMSLPFKFRPQPRFSCPRRHATTLWSFCMRVPGNTGIPDCLPRGPVGTIIRLLWQRRLSTLVSYFIFCKYNCNS